MAKTKYLKFRGIVSYAMVYKADEYNDNRFWKLNLHPKKEVIEAIRAAGIQNKLKDDTGNIPNAEGPYFSFKRPCEKEFNGEITKFCPPEILDKNGKKIVYYVDEDGRPITQFTGKDRPERVGEPIIIGNGSEIELTLEVYPTKRFGNGSRFNSVKIIDLIEYNPDDQEEVEPDEVETKDEPDMSKKETKEVKSTKSSVGW